VKPKLQNQLNAAFADMRKALKGWEGIELASLSGEMPTIGAFSEDAFEVHQSFAEGLPELHSSLYATSSGTVYKSKTVRRVTPVTSSEQRSHPPFDSPGQAHIETSKANPYGPLKSQGSILYLHTDTRRTMSMKWVAVYWAA
jgi:hypothetical protein